MKTKLLILATLLFFSCSDIDSTEKDIIDGVENSTTNINTPTPPERMINIMTPIQLYDNYFLDESNNIFGIDNTGLTPILIVDENENELYLETFFKLDDDLYFEILTSTPEDNFIDYFKQSENTISIINILPTKPELLRPIWRNDDFGLSQTNVDGILCTDVRNFYMSSGIERFFMVNGTAYVSDHGLYFNVTDGRYNEEIIVRENALYFWDKSLIFPEKVKEVGEIW